MPALTFSRVNSLIKDFYNLELYTYIMPALKFNRVNSLIKELYT